MAYRLNVLQAQSVIVNCTHFAYSVSKRILIILLIALFVIIVHLQYLWHHIARKSYIGLSFLTFTNGQSEKLHWDERWSARFVACSFISCRCWRWSRAASCSAAAAADWQWCDPPFICAPANRSAQALLSEARRNFKRFPYSARTYRAAYFQTISRNYIQPCSDYMTSFSLR